MFGRKRTKKVTKTDPVDVIEPFLVVPPVAPPPSPRITPFEPVATEAPIAALPPDPATAEGALPPPPTASPLPPNPAPATSGDLPPVSYKIDDTSTPGSVASPSDEPTGTGPVFEFTPTSRDLVPAPRAHRQLAERMRSSLQEMAQASMQMEVWMDHAVEMRTQLLAEWDVEGARLTYTDMTVRAVARSLLRHPLVNGVVRDDMVEPSDEINIGLAVASDGDEPMRVIAGAERRALREVATESARTADGGSATFVVESLGEYGVDAFRPIVLSPNVATLGIGRVRDVTRWEGERPVRASAMTITLTWDHRAFGGAAAAEFLTEVRDILEQPYRLLVD